MAQFEKLSFEELREAMGQLVEEPEKVTEILLGMPKDKYEALKTHLFREAFPDEQSVIKFINDLYIKNRIQDQPNFAWRIVDFLVTEQDKMALYRSEFMDAGDISLGEIKKRILEIIKSEIQQGELFPVFRPQKTVELKKEFSLNFGSLDRIEKDYKHLLNEKLTGGLTLQQHIDKVRDWFNSLHGGDLGNWIKLFAFVKAIKDYSETDAEAVNFRVIGPGRYCFSIKQNRDFFSFFIRPDKKTGQYTTKAKIKFLKWLHDNQSTIEFPMIISGKVWNVPMRIYEYAENVSDKEIVFKVDTNILESDFKDFVSINVDEINAIEETWEAIAEKNQSFTKHRLHSFVDIPLKFLLTLKNTYSRNGDFKNDKDTYVGNIRPLSGENLDAHLGSLSDRVKKHLVKINQIRTGKTGKLHKETMDLILKTTFTIAEERGWIVSMPSYENGLYKFNLNAGYFDKKHTAKRLKAIENA